MIFGPYGLFVLFEPLYGPTEYADPALSFSAVDELLEVLIVLSTNKFPSKTDMATSPVAVTPLKVPIVDKLLLTEPIVIPLPYTLLVLTP